MALSIRNPQTEAAVRELAARTGLGLTEAIDMAVRHQLAGPQAREAVQEHRRVRIDDMREWIAANVDTALILDEDDLYDANGLPR